MTRDNHYCVWFSIKLCSDKKIRANFSEKKINANMHVLCDVVASS